MNGRKGGSALPAGGPPTELVLRAAGRSGELVLRRRGRHLEVVCNGVFLISSENEESSRALVTAARPWLPARPLEVLVGGLGLGFALDEALRLPALAAVTVAEYEPQVQAWFSRFGGRRARRAAADGRARIVIADVLDVLRDDAASFDLICLDTDNGPEWLMREANAGLYEAEGVALVHAALKPAGVAAFWSPERYARFEALLGAHFASVHAVAAADTVGGRRHVYTMYTAVKGA